MFVRLIVSHENPHLTSGDPGFEVNSLYDCERMHLRHSDEGFPVLDFEGRDSVTVALDPKFWTDVYVMNNEGNTTERKIFAPMVESAE